MVLRPQIAEVGAYRQKIDHDKQRRGRTISN